MAGEATVITRIYQNTGGDHLGFATRTERYIIDFSQGPRLKDLAGDAYRHTALIDRESPFNGATALHVTGLEPAMAGARVFVRHEPTELILTRVELATLAYAMPSGR
jgi:hypothetical protein